MRGLQAWRFLARRRGIPVPSATRKTEKIPLHVRRRCVCTSNVRIGPLRSLLLLKQNKVSCELIHTQELLRCMALAMCCMHSISRDLAYSSGSLKLG
mmetsp:Transcript_1403/g.8648  ORF Transcript_1403/g.8648 Transcript_1403/m.8648 type:complete len:97 (-) Transcript_1403:1354-1644(-)